MDQFRIETAAEFEQERKYFTAAMDLAREVIEQATSDSTFLIAKAILEGIKAMIESEIMIHEQLLVKNPDLPEVMKKHVLAILEMQRAKLSYVEEAYKEYEETKKLRDELGKKL
jgi:hypothetical protein